MAFRAFSEGLSLYSLFFSLISATTTSTFWPCSRFMSASVSRLSSSMISLTWIRPVLFSPSSTKQPKGLTDATFPTITSPTLRVSLGLLCLGFLFLSPCSLLALAASSSEIRESWMRRLSRSMLSSLASISWPSSRWSPTFLVNCVES